MRKLPLFRETPIWETKSGWRIFLLDRGFTETKTEFLVKPVIFQPDSQDTDMMRSPPEDCRATPFVSNSTLSDNPVTVQMNPPSSSVASQKQPPTPYDIHHQPGTPASGSNSGYISLQPLTPDDLNMSQNSSQVLILGCQLGRFGIIFWLLNTICISFQHTGFLFHVLHTFLLFLVIEVFQMASKLLSKSPSCSCVEMTLLNYVSTVRPILWSKVPMLRWLESARCLSVPSFFSSSIRDSVSSSDMKVSILSLFT